jgi:CBS-domain-containing membrane protein
MNEFKPLAISSLRSRTGYAIPYFNSPNPVKVISSALEVMTDLHFVAAAIIPVDTDLETASQKMIARGVRSLLVVDSAHDVVGIITARDIMGDRPASVMQNQSVGFAQIKVRDVMTSAEHIEVLALEEVLHAHVGDVIETLKDSGRQHALVVEDDPIQERPVIRGIFSASQIARQLGIALQSSELSQTFAEIDRAVSRK